MKKGITALSLFDGLSVARLALQDAGIKVNKYYSSEIDKYVIGITQYNFPDTIQLGDIKKWRDWDIDWKEIDLIFGGFPCVSWSVSGKQLGDKDPRGQLMWDMIDIKKHIESLNPNVKFLFENVRMKKEFLIYINKAIGVEPVLINSAKLSAQQRLRNYWTNIEGNDDSDLFQKKIGQPKDKHIYLKDILEKDVDEKYFLSDKMIKYITAKGTKNYNATGELNPDKAYALTSTMAKMHRSGIDTYVCCAMRGRHIVDGKRKDEKGADTKQMIEIRDDNKTNCLTTVQKDNLLIEKPIRIGQIGNGGQGQRIYDINGKSVCLSALGGGQGACVGLYSIPKENVSLKKFKKGGSYEIPKYVIKNICDAYVEGISSQKLADEYKVNVKTIIKILKKNSIKIDCRRYRKFYLFEDYFENIESEEQAYWLGFLFADGCVSKDRDRITLALAEKDVNHLKLFSKTLNFKKYPYYNPKQKSFRVTLNSKKLKNSLVNLGCVPLKTYINIKVPNLAKNLLRHFVRGYFDGDGCITFNKLKGTYKVSIMGSNNLLSFIQDFFSLMLGLSIRKLYKDKRIITDNTFTLDYSGKQNVLSILNFLYDDASVYLERKHKKYLDIPQDDKRNRRKSGLHDIQKNNSELNRAKKKKDFSATSKTNIYQIKSRVRRLTPKECEKLQNLPDGFTSKGIINGKVVNISDSQKYKACGNSWTKDVIVWILSHFPKDEE